MIFEASHAKGAISAGEASRGKQRTVAANGAVESILCRADFADIIGKTGGAVGDRTGDALGDVGVEYERSGAGDTSKADDVVAGEVFISALHAVDDIGNGVAGGEGGPTQAKVVEVA